MPWPTYTETFVRVTTINTWSDYVVPAGRRAVVKSVAVCHMDSVTGDAYVEVAGTYLMALHVQAVGVTQVVALTAVAYAGQHIRAISSTALSHITVAGYLFREEAIARAARPEWDLVPYVGPHPAPPPIDERELAAAP